jgi:hypothetical protein
MLVNLETIVSPPVIAEWEEQFSGEGGEMASQVMVIEIRKVLGNL